MIFVLGVFGFRVQFLFRFLVAELVDLDCWVLGVWFRAGVGICYADKVVAETRATSKKRYPPCGSI